MMANLPPSLLVAKMVNPGAFLGARYSFLIDQKPTYAQAVVGGYAADCLLDIQRRYFKRFPVDCPHNVDPTPEFLVSVDDNEADPEPDAPDEDQMSAEEYQAAMGAFNTRRRLIAARKDVCTCLQVVVNLPDVDFVPQQIKRWMSYQYSKDHGAQNGHANLDDPMVMVMAKLTGSSLSKPRLPVPHNLWAKAESNREAIERLFEVRKRSASRKEYLSLRSAITRELYGKLPELEKTEWRNKAKEMHTAEVDAWRAALDSPASKEPADRQKYVF